ncbi:MAG: response regulator transcription factor [Clostridia bacterium]|nr:response regulator transcription factor [Clostridia bacterium]
MRIGICDDLQKDRNHLMQLIGDYYAARGEQVELHEYESAEELLHHWQDGWLNYLFLDVYMGRTSGMDAARKIRETDPDCVIIFTTTSPDHAIDSYEVRATDYLLKPFGRAELESTLRWCEETVAAAPREIEVETEGQIRRIPCREIRYIEVYGKQCVIHTEGEEISVNRRLGELEAELEGEGFLRCHRSCLVNMSHILRPEERDFLLLDRTRIPIAVKSAAKLKQAFFEWSFQQTWTRK